MVLHLINLFLEAATVIAIVRIFADVNVMATVVLLPLSLLDVINFFLEAAAVVATVIAIVRIFAGVNVIVAAAKTLLFHLAEAENTL